MKGKLYIPDISSVLKSHADRSENKALAHSAKDTGNSILEDSVYNSLFDVFEYNNYSG